MTIAEAARHLEVSPSTVYQLCSRGKIPHERIGVGRGTIRISADDLAAFRRESRVEGPPITEGYVFKHLNPPSRSPFPSDA